jgi:hypothetical protein
MISTPPRGDSEHTEDGDDAVYDWQAYCQVNGFITFDAWWRLTSGSTLTLEEAYVRAGNLPQIQAEEGSWFVSLLRVGLVMAFVYTLFGTLGYL